MNCICGHLSKFHEYDLYRCNACLCPYYEDEKPHDENCPCLDCLMSYATMPDED